jgi:hypothetical protein
MRTGDELREQLRLLGRSASDCEEIRRLASIELDRELSELGIRRLNRHLNGCTPCSDFTSSLTATTSALRRSSSFGAPSQAVSNHPAVSALGAHQTFMRPDLIPPA